MVAMVWRTATLGQVDAYATVEEQYNDFVKSWVNAKLKQMDEEIPPMKSSQLWDHILTPDFASKVKDKSKYSYLIWPSRPITRCAATLSKVDISVR